MNVKKLFSREFKLPDVTTLRAEAHVLGMDPEYYERSRDIGKTLFRNINDIFAATHADTPQGRESMLARLFLPVVLNVGRRELDAIPFRPGYIKGRREIPLGEGQFHINSALDEREFTNGQLATLNDAMLGAYERSSQRTGVLQEMVKLKLDGPVDHTLNKVRDIISSASR